MKGVDLFFVNFPYVFPSQASHKDTLAMFMSRNARLRSRLPWGWPF